MDDKSFKLPLIDAGARTGVSLGAFSVAGRPALMIVTKVTLDIARPGIATMVDPEPVAGEDELALGKGACDLTLVGDAIAIDNPSASVVQARFALLRNGRALFDRVLPV